MNFPPTAALMLIPLAVGFLDESSGMRWLAGKGADAPFAAECPAPGCASSPKAVCAHHPSPTTLQNLADLTPTQPRLERWPAARHWLIENRAGSEIGAPVHGEELKKLDLPPAVRFDPVQRDLEGWKVHVDPALLDGEHREEGAKALAMLANHLQRIKIVVPPEPLVKLQSIEIWIEHDHPRLKSMQYHPSRRWLLDHDHDPRLTRKVHITQARELFSRSQMLKHPAVILHELAHGYHDQILGFDHPEILAAYHRAKESGSYESVLLHTGRKVKHYGLTNHKEYFAEGVEAYFYRNDFYPFVRAELQEHDPALHELLVKIWGPAE